MSPSTVRVALSTALLGIVVTTAPLAAQDPLGVPDCGHTTARVEQLWCQGSLRYASGDYAGAIGPYQEALTLEQQHRKLARNGWLVLIDDLTIAYGITGDLTRAKATIDYGITADPTYPLFYYNLACVYAGMNDKPKTLNALRRAFDLRANVIRGETMPDPRTDDSFQSFMIDTAFARAVARLPGLAATRSTH